ncbi:peptidase [Spirilliplanes yamanashiensis]|uniref:Peptidase n=1 Tax=Spirilliplanes yamanashiensis TaxID=42233 RepID=A0A8J3YA48_9ACTN|nr:peptidase [Spirilliplanes yamanashiensis]
MLTGADHWTLADGTRHPTGFWAEEVTVPYEAFTAAGHEVVVATPGGVVPTVDDGSLTDDTVATAVEAMTELRRPIALADVRLGDYAAVYYPGGHGPMEDLATDAESGRLLGEALASGRPLGVVCHGPAALLATGADGASPFAGYRLTGFSNAEETQGGLAPRAPWLLQDRLAGLGADVVVAEPWAPHVVVDRNLVTGQNPASSAGVAEEMLRALA